ncbi:MAG: 2-amino-4-hydroxy-6-hydroxymethyldihydropteridine diphosphokinase [Stellaceae bacterium]
MILLGLGANLPSDRGPPAATIAAALDMLERQGVAIIARSHLYRSAPVPPSNQPWYINAVAAVETARLPRDLLALLHKIETAFGRERRRPNDPRTLDLDLLAYNNVVSRGGDGDPALPHPRLQDRAFVLLPLAEIAPGWRHPVLNRTVEELIADLSPDQIAEPV